MWYEIQTHMLHNYVASITILFFFLMGQKLCVPFVLIKAPFKRIQPHLQASLCYILQRNKAIRNILEW